MLGARPRVRPPPIYTQRHSHTHHLQVFGNAVLQLTAALQPSNDGMTDCRLVPLLFASPSCFQPLLFDREVYMCYCCHGSCNPHSRHGGVCSITFSLSLLLLPLSVSVSLYVCEFFLRDLTLVLRNII